VKKRRLLLALLVFVVLPGAALAFLSIDRCGEWPARPAALTHLAKAQGHLKVGAARVELAPRYPTTVGGYGPPRATVERALAPLFARALVLEVGGQRLGLVLFDALLVPPQLRDAVGQGQPFQTWVLATHTHTGPSGFDPRFASELAALGTFSQGDLDVLTKAGRAALEQALAALAPAKLEVGEAVTEQLTVPRSGAAADTRLTRLRFDGAAGPLAQLLVISGHPTLAPMRPDGLHPDWPGLLASRLEEAQGPVTLVVQGAGGNATVDRGAHPTPEAAAEAFAARVRATTTAAQPEALIAAWNEVQVTLSRPTARRLVPGLLRPAAENALCDDMEDVAVLHGLRLGDVRLLFVPVEPSLPAGLVLEQQAKVARVISLADGYAGYVETVEAARRGEGEARRQYFDAELLTRLAEGAALAGQPLE
jgi:hypothetical protein